MQTVSDVLSEVEKIYQNISTFKKGSVYSTVSLKYQHFQILYPFNGNDVSMMNGDAEGGFNKLMFVEKDTNFVTVRHLLLDMTDAEIKRFVELALLIAKHNHDLDYCSYDYIVTLNV